jgi:hypothetical protein
MNIGQIEWFARFIWNISNVEFCDGYLLGNYLLGNTIYPARDNLAWWIKPAKPSVRCQRMGQDFARCQGRHKAGFPRRFRLAAVPVGRLF